MLMIRRKYLDKFQGKFTASTGWFNLDHEWLKIKFSTLEPKFYKNFWKRILKVKISKHIKICINVEYY